MRGGSGRPGPLDGGQRVLQIENRQGNSRLRRSPFAEKAAMDGWTHFYEGFDPDRENLREALCTIGNGYFATRGAAPESEADSIHYPGVYLAGGYNRLETDLSGRIIENEDLVNMPNWLFLRFRHEEDRWFNLLSVDVISYRQELDMKKGVLSRNVSFRDRQGRETLLTDRRFVHMGKKHLAALVVEIRPLNWSGRIQVRSALDGRVVNAGVERYRELKGKHLEPVRAGVFGEDGMFLLVQTTQSNIRVAEAARTRIFDNGEERKAERKLLEEPGFIGQDFFLEAARDRPLSIEKAVSFHTSRDYAASEPALDAVESLADAGRFDELLQSHTLAWKHLWDKCDIRVEDNDRAQMILRLHIFHLLQTASMNSIDLDTGVPARGWHGEAYRGHIFWDELFIFPFLNLRIPVLTRSLLLYRYRRLDQARMAAKAEGLKGALYPWQSGSNGREETQRLHLNPKSGRWLPDNTHLQRHVNAAIAYNVRQYFETTGDVEFMSAYGAEMIIEIARCLADLTVFNGETGRYEMPGVMGPDEYHDAYPNADRPGIDNNAYTNVMTAWVLRSAVKTLDMLNAKRKEEFRETTGLENAEIERWEDIVHKMHVPFHDGAIISQFDGYEKLIEFDWDGYRKKYGNIQRLDRILEAEGDSTNRYKASKQADVLMLFYLFSVEELHELFTLMGYGFDPAAVPENVEYYLKRSSNGSTLSNVVHSWVLARSDRPGSWMLFGKALESDISDIQGGTTHEGIHLGAMSGTVDIIQRCYTGIEFRDGVLHFNPRIPEGLERLSMNIHYRGSMLDIAATHKALTIASGICEAPSARIGFRGEIRELEPGGKLSFDV